MDKKEPIKSTYRFLFALLFLSGVSLTFSSCFDESFEVSQDPIFTTSIDTLRFDTVFTTVGSATRGFKIFNPTSTNLIINSISLDHPETSNFRLNIDGVPGNVLEDIKILAGDSIYVFVEVTIDPDQPISISPFVIGEYVNIKAESGQTRVHLEAWGQNANYFPGRNTGGQIIGLTCQNSEIVWDDPKPYVIYGLLIIDSCTLRMMAGTDVYVHGGIAQTQDIIFDDGGLFFLGDASLITQGTIEDPVTFQTDRLEPEYADVGGQWSGLRFFPGSTNNHLHNTRIKNSIVGVRADSAASITISNTIIEYISNVGIIGRQAIISVENSLIHSCGGQNVVLTYGGDYAFDYSTLANYGNQSTALYADNATCLDADCNRVAVAPLNATFRNCIIVGSNEGEISVIDATEGRDPELFRLYFDHVIFKNDPELFMRTMDNCNACFDYDGQPLFLDQSAGDYRLDTMSVALDRGMPLEEVAFDLLGMMRHPMTPDLGCYEFQ